MIVSVETHTKYFLPFLENNSTTATSQLGLTKGTQDKPTGSGKIPATMRKSCFESQH